MNYPTVLGNPILRRGEVKEDKSLALQEIKFSNMKRPRSGYQHTSNFVRPFSTRGGGETLMHKRKELQNKAMAKDISQKDLR